MLLHLVSSLEFSPVEQCSVGKRGVIHHLVPRVTFPRMPFLSASWDPKHTRPWFSTTICSFWRGDACAGIAGCKMKRECQKNKDLQRHREDGLLSAEDTHWP